MTSAFNYDDALGEFSIPSGLGYDKDEEGSTGTGGSTSAQQGTSPLSQQVPKERKKILLMGMKRSGKSSISKVVFQKMSPNETLFLESTTRALKSDVSTSSFVQFDVYDFPGVVDLNADSFDSKQVFGTCGALIFVIDAQSEYSAALTILHSTLQVAWKANPTIVFEVFIHKVDGLSDDHRIETQRDLQQKVIDSLQDDGLDGVHPSFHLTSIYDHSIFESMSKVIQKLTLHQDTLENLLDILISNCSMEKAFLIDTSSKIYIATDSSPVDMGTYELCSDVIDVVVDLSCIYGEGDSNSSVMKLKKPNSKIVLYLQAVNQYLALVCLMREENFTRPGVVNFNFRFFKEALQEVLRANN